MTDGHFAHARGHWAYMTDSPILRLSQPLSFDLSTLAAGCTNDRIRRRVPAQLIKGGTTARADTTSRTFGFEQCTFRKRPRLWLRQENLSGCCWRSAAA